MSAQFQAFLTDSLVWTGVLIALVLLLRRPVARHFGAQAAYALWFVPLLRLAVPPLELPAWLRPADGAAEAAPAAVVAVPETAFAAPYLATEPLLPSPQAAGLFDGVDFATPLLALWLAGAAVFLVRRFHLYHVMRRELLEDARPVGEAGAVRLVESPAISGPVAFGVRDKVVALPAGFMASFDRRTRDLALEHELAHHRGHDLLVNFLVQPLFALHWFNPLGWAGWRALRADQEAACDARVVARRSRAERAAYAGIIADYACRATAMPRAALAAPMACPVLGDKSIIHRLRSLNHMGEISPRRRTAARLAIGASLLALPLTASISYAESTPLPPPPPAAPAPPEAPFAPEAPLAPQAPVPPVAEGDLRIVERRIVREGGEGDGERRVEVRRIARDGEPVRIERRAWKNGGEPLTAEEEAELARDLAEMREDLHRELGENGTRHREVQVAMAEAHAGAAMARAAAPRVVQSCPSKDQPVTSVTENGRTTLYVCEEWGDRVALDSLRRARATIASTHGLSDDVRRDILGELDAEIADLDH